MASPKKNELSSAFSRVSRLQEFETPSGHTVAASPATMDRYGENRLKRIADTSGRNVLYAAPGDFRGPEGDNTTLYMLHPEYFPHGPMTAENERLFLENANDFGTDAGEGSPSAHIWNSTNGEKTCTVALDDPDTTPKEIFAGMAGLDQRYLGDIPGDARSWGRYTLEHEGAHCAQDLFNIEKLEKEAGADRVADANYAQALKNGENLDPAVPGAWKGARAIGVMRNVQDVVTALDGDLSAWSDLSTTEASETANAGYNIGPFVRNPEMPFSDQNMRDATDGAVQAKTAVNTVLGAAYAEDYLERNGGSITVGDRQITKDSIAGLSQEALKDRILVGDQIGQERPDLQYGAAKTVLDKGVFEQGGSATNQYAQQTLQDYTAATKQYAPVVANEKVAAQVAQDYDTASKAISQQEPDSPAPTAQPQPESQKLENDPRNTPSFSAPAPAPAPAPPSF